MFKKNPNNHNKKLDNEFKKEHTLARALKLLTPSSIARSMSSKKLSVAPRMIRVAIRDSFSSWRKMTTDVSPNSSV